MLFTESGSKSQQEQTGQQCQENHKEQNRQQNLQLGPPPQEVHPALPETHLGHVDRQLHQDRCPPPGPQQEVTPQLLITSTPPHINSLTPPNLNSSSSPHLRFCAAFTDLHSVGRRGRLSWSVRHLLLLQRRSLVAGHLREGGQSETDGLSAAL